MNTEHLPLVSYIKDMVESLVNVDETVWDKDRLTIKYNGPVDHKTFIEDVLPRTGVRTWYNSPDDVIHAWLLGNQPAKNVWQVCLDTGNNEVTVQWMFIANEHHSHDLSFSSL